MARNKTPKWLEAARHSGKARPAGKPDWLSRALARAGVLPLPDAERAIREGRVTLSGRTVREPLAPLRPNEEVRLDGQAVSVAPVTRVLMFHKPAGVVTSTQDPEGKGTVFERLFTALPNELRGFGWHAVGRLDRNTTGLLLFTNDERFVAHATSPATHLPKRYVAHVLGKADEAKLEPLRKGIRLHDGPARPAVVQLRAPGVVALTLTEGRNHQVKRMLGEVGLPVTALHREAVGAITLDVDEGKLRQLTDEEVREGLGFDPVARG
jgi:23S rRNA pseudouridine2605 synthase/16S rRNA pseudouridine516 synthase